MTRHSFTDKWEPCAPKDAALVKVVFDEGGVLFGTRQDPSHFTEK